MLKDRQLLDLKFGDRRLDPVEGYASNQYYSKYELVGELGPEARAFSDTSIDLNTAYYYYVLSVGESVPWKY